MQYLDGAVAAVDPDPVAAVQEHGGVAASDDGGDAEFAGHDRGVGQRRADVGYDCGGAGEDRRPVKSPPYEPSKEVIDLTDLRGQLGSLESV